MANKKISSRGKSGQGRRRSTKARHVIAAQREINQDYKALADDYGTLAMRLWRIPATRYVLGGIAVATLVPVVIKALRKIPQVDHFMDENMDAMRDKMEELENRLSEKFSNLTDRKESVSREADQRH